MSTSTGTEKADAEQTEDNIKSFTLVKAVAKAPSRIVANIASQKLKNGLAKFIDNQGTSYESVTIRGAPAFIFLKDSSFRIAEITDRSSHPVIPVMPQCEFAEFHETMQVTQKADLYTHVHRLVEAYTGFGPTHCHILAATVMLSYMQDRFSILPFDSIYGGTGNSKTTSLLLLQRIAYRAVLIDFADFARVANMNKGYNFNGEPVPHITTLIDEVDVTNPERLTILKADTKWHSHVSRKTGQIVKNNFGLKVIASQHPIVDEALQRRAIMLHVVSSKPVKDIFNDDEKSFAQLKTDLLLWGMRAAKENQEMGDIPDFGQYTNYWRPLLIAATNTEGFNPLLEFFKNEFNRRKNVMQKSLKGEMARILQDYLPYADRPRSFVWLWDDLAKALGGTDASYNERTTVGLPDGRKLTKKEVSKILNDEFGITTTLGRDQDKVRRMLVYPDDLRQRLAKYR